MKATLRVCISLFLGVALLALGGCNGNGPETTPAEDEAVLRHNIIGTSLLSQQKWEEAKTEFNKALAIRPDDPVLLVNLSVALLQQAREEEAETFLRRAIETDPGNLHAHYNLGNVERNRGNLEEAAAHFALVTEADSGDVSAAYNLASVLTRLGKNEQAEKEFRRALALNPTHVSSLYGLGRLLLQTGRRDEGTEMIAASQEIRARSGVDEAMGTQYGEQGPYAMGIDYPGGGLAAPDPIAVKLEPMREPAGMATSLTPLTILPATETRGPSVVYVAKDGIRTDPGSAGKIAPLPTEGTVGSLAAGNIDDDDAVEIVGLIRTGPREVALAVLGGDGPAWSTAGTRTAVADSTHADVVLVDRDHDGDLDVFGCAGGEAGTTWFLADNDGTGALELHDSGTGLGLGPLTGPVDLTFSDVDRDRDIDLIAAHPGGVTVFLNMRDGSFMEVIPPPSLKFEGGRAVAVADVNKDSWMDLVVATPDGPRIYVNDRGLFLPAEIQPGTVLGDAANPAGVVVLDYDNDGFLDIAGTAGGSLRFYRNLGLGEWAETTTEVVGDSTLVPLVAVDLDGDGGLDLVAADASGPIVLRNAGASSNQWVQFELQGVRDNNFGVGTKVEVMAGALRQKFEITAPLPVHAGLGHRDRVDGVRLVWPGGVIQDELAIEPGTREIAQLDRKGTSCPLMYAWRDGGWRFVTDFLGGCAIGYRHAPDVLSVPDTDEYVKIEGGLSEIDGQLRLRLNNQLEEVIWFDQTELVVVDHPAGSVVFPDEKLMPGPPWPEFRLFASHDIRRLAGAREVESGRDVTDRLAERDQRYADGFETLAYKGYAEAHTLELDLGDLPHGARAVLLLYGWIDYADSTSNLAAHQAGAVLVPPRLSVADGRGGWKLVTDRMGFPAGLPKTMTVDVTGIFPSSDRRVRIDTTMSIYWDRARVMVGGEEIRLRVKRLQPATADLRYGGFPRPLSEGRTPLGYDPTQVSSLSPWKTHAGSYTSFGNVRDLVLDIDDRFVTTRNGDEIELTFAAPESPPPGWSRTYLLYADGFGKDMDPNSAANEHVGPIPFHGMPLYPYGPDVRPPVDPQPSARVVVHGPDGDAGAAPLASKLH